MSQQAEADSSFFDIDELIEPPSNDYETFVHEATEGIDEGIPSKSGRQQFVEEAEQRLRLEKELSRIQMAAFQEVLDRNPEFRKFGLDARVRVFRKRPAGFTQVIPKIVEVLTWTGRSERTQAAVLQEALSKLSGQSVSANIWTRKLSPSSLRRAKEKIRGLAPHIDIKGCTTLSEIKKAITAQKKASSNDKSAKVCITITSDSVVINNTVLPIFIGKSGEHTYSRVRVNVGNKRQWIRVDALQALLFA